MNNELKQAVEKMEKVSNLADEIDEWGIRDIAKEALAALKEKMVTHVWMPREPTEYVLGDMWGEWLKGGLFQDRLKRMYKAMITTETGNGQ